MAKLFPEITMKGLGVELKLYPFEEKSTTNPESIAVLLDDGHRSVCIARCDSYDLATEVIQCFMTACAALGYDLESVD
jgi:hypothetical protein